MHQVMMVRTEQDQIIHAGLAPALPVLHMATMQESIVRVGGKSTAPVAQLQHPANCRRYRSPAKAVASARLSVLDACGISPFTSCR